MKRTNERVWSSWVVAVVVAASGCSSEPGGATEQAYDAVEAAPAAARPADRIEEGLRGLDRGEDPAAARRAFEAVLADRSATPDELDRARLGLSRAFEAEGDAEGAIEALEDLLEAHPDGGQFGARDEAEKRLRRLLTGKEEDGGGRRRAPTDFAPVARALAAGFVADPAGRVLVDVLAFGPTGEDLGVLSVGDAKRDLMREECPLCESVSISQSVSRHGHWSSLPMTRGEVAADMPHVDRSLLVFYYDLGAHRVPARYDAYLPMPSDAIAHRLEQGKGLIAVRKRPGAQPTVVIAAPRAAQLDVVERAFAQMSTLPTEPVEIDVPGGLLAPEIQGVVRDSRGGMRRCYEALLARDPRAEGKIDLAFTIAPEGTVRGENVAETSTLREGAFDRCMLDVVRGLRFPATERETQVTYPIALSP